MARFVDTIDLPVTPEEAFDDLAAFENTAAWDPAVVSARRLSCFAPGGASGEHPARAVASARGAPGWGRS